MKSMIECEWGTLKTYLPPIVITAALVCFFLVLGSGEISGVCGAGVAATLIVASSFAGYDEQNGWMRYRCALPFSRGELVRGRYAIVALVGLGLEFACLVLACAMGTVLSLVGHGIESAALTDLLLAVLASEGFGLLIVSVALPFYYKFGAVRGVRIFACAGLVAGALFGFAANSVSEDFFSSAVSWINANAALLAVAVIIVSLAVYAASGVLSANILKRKDM